MRIPSALVSRPVVRILVLAAAFAWATGCASVEHVRLYREARTDFSAAAREENGVTLQRLLPSVTGGRVAAVTRPSTAPAQPAPVPTVAADDLRSPGAVGTAAGLAEDGVVAGRYDRWRGVAEVFQALNARAERELRADQLYGSSKTLELLARVQRDFYGFILGNAGDSPTAQPSPLTEPLEAARKLLDEAGGTGQPLVGTKLVIFERDRYLLGALPAQVRYRIAYLRADEYEARGQWDLAKLQAVVDETSAAEEELERVAKATKVAAYETEATLARLTMLASVDFLVFDHKDVAGLGQITGGMPQNVGSVQKLAERIKEVRARALGATSDPAGKEHAERRTLRAVIGRDPTSADLTRMNLRPFMPD